MQSPLSLEKKSERSFCSSQQPGVEMCCFESDMRKQLFRKHSQLIPISSCWSLPASGCSVYCVNQMVYCVNQMVFTWKGKAWNASSPGTFTLTIKIILVYVLSEGICRQVKKITGYSYFLQNTSAYICVGLVCNLSSSDTNKMFVNFFD